MEKNLMKKIFHFVIVLMGENLECDIVFNLNKHIKIPRQFPNIGKLSPKVFRSLTADPFQYEIQSHVNAEYIKPFISYLIGEKELDINCDNFLEYFILSQEFGILTDYKQFVEKKLQTIEGLIQNQQFLHNEIQNLKSQVENLKEKIRSQQIFIQNNSDCFIVRIEEFQNSIISSVDEKIAQQNQLFDSFGESRENYDSLREEIANLRNEISTSLNLRIVEQNDNFENVTSRINNQLNELRSQFDHQEQDDRINLINQKLEVIIQQNSQNLQKFITKEQLRNVMYAGSSGEYLPFIGKDHYFESFDYNKHNPNLAIHNPPIEYYKGQWLKDWERAMSAIPP